MNDAENAIQNIWNQVLDVVKILLIDKLLKHGFCH